MFSPQAPAAALTNAPSFASRWPLLAFGLLLAFLSNFGQTFYIALFNPALRAEFGLSHIELSSLYSAATLGSGLLLLYFGSLFDRSRTRTFTIATMLLVALACLLMSAAKGPAMLLVGFFLVRFGGQGLLTMISSVTMARYFLHNRGKALAVASLGFPLGELLLPVASVALLLAFGWRLPWLIASAMVLLALPLMLILIGNASRRLAGEVELGHAYEIGHQWTRGEAMRDSRFYVFVALIIAGPFILTGLFFHQAYLAQFKGWTLAWIATAMVAYALGHLSGLLVGAIAVDRFTAVRLLPYFMLPFALGLVLLSVADQPVVALVYLGSAGLSMGLARSVGSAAMAEVYGVRHLGAIRSLTSMLFVIATAVAPLLFGWLIENAVSMDTIVATCAAYVFAGSTAAWLARARFVARSPG